MPQELDGHRVLELRYGAVYREYQANTKFLGMPKLPRKLKRRLRRYHDDNATYGGVRIPARVLKRMWRQSWLDECRDFQELGGFAMSMPGCVKEIADDVDARCLSFMLAAAEQHHERINAAPLSETASSFAAVFGEAT